MICQNCKCSFKVNQVIDGKMRNLGNRKFCLTCSPFGSKNTRPDINAPKIGSSKRPYKTWSEDKKFKNREAQYFYRFKRMTAAIDSKGGCCSKCGYKKCFSALEFHHIDPSTKKFELNARTLLSKSAIDVKTELEKCILLCANCHRELHAVESKSRYHENALHRLEHEQ